MTEEPAAEPDASRLQVADGERIYAIGDIHGRLDLFMGLLKAIVSDFSGGPRAPARIVVLGDVIDRGPDSAKLVRRFMRYTAQTDRFIVLKGNHEEIMVQALRGDMGLFHRWMEFGGDATLKSWGVDLEGVDRGSTFALIKEARRLIGEDALEWMEELPTRFQSGGVLFVHAGVRPGVAIEDQSPSDLLWIREDFLESEDVHSALIVHGHTIEPDGPVVKANRIGVDTGAYKTGRLSAVRLEGSDVRLFST